MSAYYISHQHVSLFLHKQLNKKSIFRTEELRNMTTCCTRAVRQRIFRLETTMNKITAPPDTPAYFLGGSHRTRRCW